MSLAQELNAVARKALEAEANSKMQPYYEAMHKAAEEGNFSYIITTKAGLVDDIRYMCSINGLAILKVVVMPDVPETCPEERTAYVTVSWRTV